MNYVLTAVAVLSAVASVLSWRASRDAATSAQEVAELDKARRHEERTPVFSARFGRASWSDATQATEGVDVVWFDYLNGPRFLSDVSVELVARSEGKPQPIIQIAGVESEEWGQMIRELYPFDLELGTEPLILVERHPENPAGDAVFLLRCRGGAGEEWVVPVRCEVPEGMAALEILERGQLN